MSDIEKLIERLRMPVPVFPLYWSGADLATEAIDALSRFEKRERALRALLQRWLDWDPFDPHQNADQLGDDTETALAAADEVEAKR